MASKSLVRMSAFGLLLALLASVTPMARAAALAITTPATQTAVVGNQFSLQIVVSGGTGGNQFAVATGTLPAGLALDANTGIISGSPTASISAAMTIRVTDNSSATATTSSFLINTGWMVTTYAGNGNPSSSGDSGTATSAGMSPHGLAVATNGTVYIGDSTGFSIRKVGADGIINTVVNNVSFTNTGMAVSNSGDLFVSYYNPSGRVYKYTASSSTFAAWSNSGTTLNQPRGLYLDGSGNIYAAEAGGHRVRKISSAGTVTLVAGTGTASDTGDGGQATSATLYTPADVALDSSGNLYISELASGCKIRKVNTSGIISTILGGACTYGGDNGLATNATSAAIWGIAIDGEDNIFFAERNGHAIRRIDAVTGVVTKIAGSGSNGVTGQAANSISSNTIFSSLLSFIRFDTSGNLYVVDLNNYIVRKIANVGAPFAPPVASANISASGTIRKGVSQTVSANVTQAGRLTFYANGKKIPGCISLAVQAGTVNCAWKPNTSGSFKLSALLIPADSTYANGRSTLSVVVGRRATTR